MKEVTATDWLRIVRSAGTAVGLDVDPAEPIQVSENAIYRPPGSVVARVSRPGRLAAGLRAVDVARWLEASGVPAVQVVPDVDQPVEVDGRAATFWRELPPREHGSPAQVAALLEQLHRLPPPTGFDLGEVAPFVRPDERIAAAATSTRMTGVGSVRIRQTWGSVGVRFPARLPWCVIHGDAWVGTRALNCCATSVDRA
ncbi:phosphotransferase [Nocardia sp. 2YAB30]|uniref:phosphotransferase n=1 Tax=unclassified Nocardia TaxID=2637762 RepID=UPI003F9AF3A0